MILWIEYLDGVKKDIPCDDICVGEQCLKYTVSHGIYRGEYQIPLCTLRIFKIIK